MKLNSEQLFRIMAGRNHINNCIRLIEDFSIYDDSFVEDYNPNLDRVIASAEMILNEAKRLKEMLTE